MKLRSTVLQAVFGMGLVLSLTTLAEAQATRTWVSGVGDDANPCSRTAPCKTFAGAISKTAAGGYIDALDPGGFGAVTITKSITIEGDGTMASILASLTNGVIINAAGIVVTLRNLNIQGAGNGLNGIRVLNTATVFLENVNIQDFTQNAIDFLPPAGNSALFVQNVTARHNTGAASAGILIQNARATIDHFKAEGNASGLKANASALVTVRDSYAGGGGEGFSTGAASAIVNIENSISTNNVFGVNASLGGTIRISNSGILSNTNTGIFKDGTSTIISMQGNSINGNPTPGTFSSTSVKQ